MTERNILHKSFHSFFFSPSCSWQHYLCLQFFLWGGKYGKYALSLWIILFVALLTLAIKTLYAFENFLARSFQNLYIFLLIPAMKNQEFRTPEVFLMVLIGITFPNAANSFRLLVSTCTERSMLKLLVYKIILSRDYLVRCCIFYQISMHF